MPISNPQSRSPFSNLNLQSTIIKSALGNRQSAMLFVLAAALLATGIPMRGQQAPAAPAATIAQRTTGLERHDGYVPFYLDAVRNRVLIEVPKLNDDILYFVQVAKGIGNVDLGIDRGAGGASKVISFERQGNRAAIVERNLRFRAPALLRQLKA